MRRPNRMRLAVVTAALLAVVLPLILVPLLTSSEIAPPKDAILGSLVGSRIAMHIFFFVAYAFAVYEGFQVNAWWGLVNLLLPFAVFLFVILYWRRCRDVFLFFGLGVFFLVIHQLVT